MQTAAEREQDIDTCIAQQQQRIARAERDLARIETRKRRTHRLIQLGAILEHWTGDLEPELLSSLLSAIKIKTHGEVICIGEWIARKSRVAKDRKAESN